MVTTCSLSTLVGYSQPVEGDESQRDPVIWDVSFEGNENYSSVVLRNVISARSPNFFRKLVRSFDNYRLDETELRRDGVRIERYYGRRGYDQAEVEVEISEKGDEWKKNVLFKIREGEPIRVKSASVVIGEDATGAGALDLSEPFLKDAYDHALREGQPYQTIRIPEVEGAFTEKLQNNGFPWAEVSVEAEVDSAGKSADVKIELRPGAKSFFTNFMYDGIQTVPERIIRREMEIRNGGLFDRRKLQNAQRQIFGHHLFRFATITLPEQPRDSTLDMQVRIRENPPRTLETMIGVGSEDLLRGQVSWRHRNINGTGHRLGFNLRGSFIEQRIGADYLVPYVFNSRSSFVAAPFAQRRLEPAFELMRLGITNSLIYQIERAKTVTGSYEFTINEEVSRRQEVSLPDTVQGFNISSLAFTGYFSENISRDPEGWVLQPSIELSGTFGEATFRFQKLTMDVRRYEPVSSTTTLAGRINLGTIFYTQPDSLPSNIRFFTGGTNSVRGWSRQDLGPKRPAFLEGEFDGFVPVGGRAVFTFNLEVRQQLNFLFNGFGMGVFLDGGQVWRAIDRISERPVQFGTGGGLRYQSPIGPVRIDIGYKINPFDEDLGRFRGEDRGSAWDRIGIHFSIGQAF
ncbi:MAG: BamA/TamA family outer membrane protein [Bacteroidetes bacterium]|nr:BamA/TamA family outer membrane protein [Bacteroidota bacterium]